MSHSGRAFPPKWLLRSSSNGQPLATRCRPQGIKENATRFEPKETSQGDAKQDLLNSKVYGSRFFPSTPALSSRWWNLIMPRARIVYIKLHLSMDGDFAPHPFRVNDFPTLIIVGGGTMDLLVSMSTMLPSSMVHAYSDTTFMDTMGMPVILSRSQ